MSTTKTLPIVLTAVMTSLLCVLAPLSIPLPGLVPVSLATFAIYLNSYILGWKKSAASVAVYLAMGLAGLPVFSAFRSGPAILFGPTGGYLVGYLPLAAICGLVYSSTDRKLFQICGSIAATSLLYLIGTAWLMAVTGLSLLPALMAGMIPFIPGDLLKIIMAVFLGPRIRTAVSGINMD